MLSGAFGTERVGQFLMPCGGICDGAGALLVTNLYNGPNVGTDRAGQEEERGTV